MLLYNKRIHFIETDADVAATRRSNIISLLISHLPHPTAVQLLLFVLDLIENVLPISIDNEEMPPGEVARYRGLMAEGAFC